MGHIKSILSVKTLLSYDILNRDMHDSLDIGLGFYESTTGDVSDGFLYACVNLSETGDLAFFRDCVKPLIRCLSVEIASNPK